MRLAARTSKASLLFGSVSAVCALQDFELAGWCSLSLGGAAPSAAPDHARAGGHGAADSFLVLSGGGRRGPAMGAEPWGQPRRRRACNNTVRAFGRARSAFSWPGRW